MFRSHGRTGSHHIETANKSFHTFDNRMSAPTISLTVVLRCDNLYIVNCFLSIPGLLIIAAHRIEVPLSLHEPGFSLCRWEPKRLSDVLHKENLVFSLSSSSQPKARFYTRVNENDFLGMTVWQGKTDPTAEVLVVQIRHRDGDDWKTVGRMAVYRSSSGVYSKLPERK